MDKLKYLFLLLIFAIPARAQTPPLFAANAKYLGWAGTGGGTGNAQTVTYSPALTGLTSGQAVSWIPSNANSGAATLNINALGAESIVKIGGAALAANDLITTAVAQVVYDGTNFELLDPQTGPGNGPTSVFTRTGAVTAMNGDYTCSQVTGCATVIASGTSTMGTGSISSGTCATTVTTTATGVAATDAIIVSVNADPTSTTGYIPATTGALYIWAFPTSGNVNFRVCNNSVNTITPSAITLNWRVVR